MANFPKLKKKIHSFLTKEDGKISKENLIKAGILLSAVAVSLKDAYAGHASHNNHSNALALADESTKVTATHSHAVSSHNQHASHGSHSSHNSRW